MGLQREPEPPEDDEPLKYVDESDRAKVQAENLRRDRIAERALTCVAFNSTTRRLIGTGEHWLLEVEFDTGKVVQEGPVKFLGASDVECEGGFENDSSKQVISMTTDVKVLCEGVHSDKQSCNFVIPRDGKTDFDVAALSGICSLGYRSDDLWICVRGSSDDRIEGTTDETASVAIIDWPSRRAFIRDDEYFAHIFDHHLGFSDFSVTRANGCQRVVISYSNWQRGGGARQPDGALIFDRATGNIVAEVADTKHPVFCSVDGLIAYLKSMAAAFTPAKISLDAAAVVSQPKKAIAK